MDERARESSRPCQVAVALSHWRAAAGTGAGLEAALGEPVVLTVGRLARHPRQQCSFDFRAPEVCFVVSRSQPACEHASRAADTVARVSVGPACCRTRGRSSCAGCGWSSPAGEVAKPR